jgi:TonB family protein
VSDQANFRFFWCLGCFFAVLRNFFWRRGHGIPRAFLVLGYFDSPKGTCRMRFKGRKFALAAAAVFLLSGVVVRAQTGTTDESKRKVKTKVAPIYPELARRMNVAGKVKIEVVISPDGHVKTTRVVGGHPLLVQTCQDAVREWKFAPAPEETTQIVEFEFRAAE